MTDYTYDLCPRCQATGTITESYLPILEGATVITCRERPCTACDGLGRIKVPVGYRLEPVPVYGAHTTSGTTAGDRVPI